MNDLERDLRTILERDAERAPLVTQAPTGLRRAVRVRQVGSTLVGIAAAVVVAAMIAGALVLLPGGRTRPADEDRPLERSNVLGISIEHPADWPLVRVATYPMSYEDGREIAPVFELTNFDPEPSDGDRRWICPFVSGAVPDDGVVLYVQEVLHDPVNGPGTPWPAQPTDEQQGWWTTPCAGEEAARFEVNGRTYEAFLTGRGTADYPQLLEAFRSMTFSESPVEQTGGMTDVEQLLTIGNAAPWVLASGELEGVPWSLLGLLHEGEPCLAAEIDGRTSDLACSGELGAPEGGLGTPIVFEASGIGLAFGLASAEITAIESVDQAMFENRDGAVVRFPAGWRVQPSAYVAPGPPQAQAIRAFDASGQPVDGATLPG